MRGKKLILVAVMFLLVVLFSLGSNFSTTYVDSQDNLTYVYINITNFDNISENKSVNLSMTFGDNESFMYSAKEANYTSLKPIEVYLQKIEDLSFNFTFNNKSFNYSGIDCLASANCTFFGENASLSRRNHSNATNNFSGTDRVNLTTINDSRFNVNEEINASFFSLKENYTLNEPLQIGIRVENNKEFDVHALLESNDSSFNQSLEKHGSRYETSFFTLMDKGEYNLTVNICKNSSVVKSLQKDFSVYENNQSSKESLQKEDGISMDVVSPAQNESFRPGEKIRFVVRVNSSISVDEVYAKILWGDGSITQNLYNIENNTYSTDFFNAMDNGLYEARMFANSTNESISKNVTFEITKSKRMAKEKKFITIKSRDKKLLKEAVLFSSEDKKEGLQNALEKNKNVDKLRIRDVTKAIKNMEFNNITASETIDLGVEDLERQEYKQSFAIDPERLNFSNAVVNVTAQGHRLYKCADWNFTSQKCLGEWAILKDDLVPGEEYSINLTKKDPAFGETGIEQCVAQDAAPSSGTWDSSCDNSYPGPELLYDDSEYEVHSIEKKGGNLGWAGIRINSINSSVNNCDAIDSVSFCYKWWAETTRTGQCDISVDAQGDGSYSTVTTDCPPDGETGGITCVDVTSLEDWQCENFFGENAKGAIAKSELTSSGGGGNGVYDIYWDAFYFNITYTDNPPSWSSNKSSIVSTYSPDTKSRFNITWEDNVAVDTALFESNFSGVQNYTMDNSSKPVYTYEKVMPAGDYYWRSYANDTLGNWSSSDTWHFSIAKAEPSLNLVAKPGWEITYGSITNITCGGNDQITPRLFRNGSYVGTSDVQKLSASIYNYTCNATETQNYTSASTFNMLNITKAEGRVDLYLNGTRKNRTVENETMVNITAVLDKGDGNISLNINNTYIIEGSSPIEELHYFDKVGLYKITANYSGNENYTFDNEIWWINVTPGPPPDYPPEWSDNETTIQTPYAPEKSFFNITWQDDHDVDKVYFETNKTGEAVNYSMNEVGQNIYGHSTTYSASKFYWKSYANDTLGNWSESIRWNFTIQRADPGLSLSSLPSWESTYGTQTNVSCDAATSQTSPVLYRNETKIDNLEDIQTLNAGIYNYTCNTTQTQNYTSSAVSKKLKVDKAEGEAALSLNGARNNIVVENNTRADIKAELLNGSGNINVMRNNTVLYDGEAPYNEKVLFNKTTTYNITLYYEGSSNYKPDSESWSVKVIPTPPVSTKLTTQNCDAEDAAEENGTFTSACDYNYPGPFLFYDDNYNETHQVRKQGNNLYWAGLRLNNSNSSIDKCVNVEEVKLCYKWWTNTRDVDSCYFAVDADNGTSYSVATTKCPSYGEPGDMTCVDVTDLESWSCDSFFGENSQAMIKSEVRSSGGDNTYYDVFWDVMHFNVSYVQDVTPPEVYLSEPAPLIYAHNQAINISTEITDKNEVGSAYANITWNGTYEIVELKKENSEYAAVFKNTTYLGEYNLTIYANDTYGNLNNTESVSFTVKKDPYHLFYGNVSATLNLGRDSSALYSYGSTQVKNVYAADSDSDFAFEDLYPLGRKTDGTASSQDFAELDNLLNLTNYTRGFRLYWAIDNSTPKNTMSFNVSGSIIDNVPYINSTENGNFVTGLLWDASDSADDEFDLTDKEDIVLITKYSPNTTGRHGIYGLELLVPQTLGEYSGTTNKIQVLKEI